VPTYTYNCLECGVYDLSHSMDYVVSECPRCNGKDVSKVFNNVGVQFKGSGFYSTDSRSK
jgi:putative FmdB family regulatory protein